jgi:hypothetical protein
VYIVLAIALLLALLLAGDMGRIDGARAVCAILILFVSNEVMGAALAYRDAERMAEQVGNRLELVKATGYRQDDLLLILGDYNAVVEATPMYPKGLYERRREKLNYLWAEHTGTA